MEYDLNISQQYFKVVVVGPCQGGKTSIINNFLEKNFNENEQKSIGVSFSKKSFQVNSTNVELMIWDIGGDEKYKSITMENRKRAHAIIVVYDISDRVTFEQAAICIKEAQEYKEPNSQLVLLANKVDKQRIVSYQEGDTLAKANNMLFNEVSAKEGTNIMEAFFEITKKLIGPTSKISISLDNQPPPAQKSKCY